MGATEYSWLLFPSLVLRPSQHSRKYKLYYFRECEESLGMKLAILSTEHQPVSDTTDRSRYVCSQPKVLLRPPKQLVTHDVQGCSHFVRIVECEVYFSGTSTTPPCVVS